MKLSKGVHQRLKSLKINLQSVDECYVNIKRDFYKDVGIEHDTWYPENEETEALFKKGEDLYELRKDMLFTAILNFNQTFSTLKDYLREYAPMKAELVADFFTKENVDYLSRNRIANDLKHRPERDLKFDTRFSKQETIVEPSKITCRSHVSQSWYSDKIDTVEHCHKLYEDLKMFLQRNFQ